MHFGISKFPQVDHADASGELAEIYDDIQCTLRAPWVPFAIDRAMAAAPSLGLDLVSPG